MGLRNLLSGRSGPAQEAEAERVVRILTGAIALFLFTSAVFYGVKYTNGDLHSAYTLYASFDTAGQGLSARSDVKVHGVNIGRVKSVALVNGRARVKMEIRDNQHVPVTAKAVVQPKTLFGEKFVDLDPGPPQTEVAGPFLADGATVTNTVGGFELENVLGAAYPLLKDIHPEDLTAVLDNLAQAGAGEGPAINRQLGNFGQLADLGVAHTLDTQRILSDLSLLSNSIANGSPDLIALAQSLNGVLPAVNERRDEVTSILGNLSRVSNDVANILDANRPAQDKLVNQGGQLLSLLVPRVNEFGPAVVGVRQFAEVLAEIGHIPINGGSTAAAIKLVLGGGCPFGQVAPCGPTGTYAGKPGPAASSATTGSAAAAGSARVPTAPGATASGSATALAGPAAAAGSDPHQVSGLDALVNLLQGLLR